MKKIHALVAVLILSFVFFTSCSKDSSPSFPPATLQPDQVFSARLVPGQGYTLTLGNSGRASISRQAFHYQVSEAGMNAETKAVVYKYIPAADFTGVDEVSLVYQTEGSEQANAGCPNAVGGNRTTYVTIKFTVAN